MYNFLIILLVFIPLSPYVGKNEIRLLENNSEAIPRQSQTEELEQQNNRTKSARFNVVVKFERPLTCGKFLRGSSAFLVNTNPNQTYKVTYQISINTVGLPNPPRPSIRERRIPAGGKISLGCTESRFGDGVIYTVLGEVSANKRSKGAHEELDGST